MLDSTKTPDYTLGCLQLRTMALAVIEGQAITVKTLTAGNGETGGGIKSTGKENDGWLHHGARIYLKIGHL
jgi:hypothetical protein